MLNRFFQGHSTRDSAIAKLLRRLEVLEDLEMSGT
jgi:hypothetical protein